MLPHGAILINTTRGEVVNEAALIERLQSGHLHSAGLDTLAVEPLLALENVVLTPLVGGSTPAALAAMAENVARNVMAAPTGAPPSATRCVNPQILT